MEKTGSKAVSAVPEALTADVETGEVAEEAPEERARRESDGGALRRGLALDIPVGVIVQLHYPRTDRRHRVMVIGMLQPAEWTGSSYIFMLAFHHVMSSPLSEQDLAEIVTSAPRPRVEGRPELQVLAAEVEAIGDPVGVVRHCRLR